MRPWTLVRRTVPFAVVAAVAAASLVSTSDAAAPAVVTAEAKPAEVTETVVPPVDATDDEARPDQEASPSTPEADEPEPAAELTRSTKTFSLLGVTWDAGSTDEDPTVEVRWRSLADGWSDWTTLETSPTDPASTDVRPGTDPLWVGESDGVDVRVSTPSGRSPSGVRVSTVTDGEDGGAMVPTAAAVGQPKIISRASWGAKSGSSCSAPVYGASMLGTTLHHTAGSNSYTKAQSAGIVRSTQAYHTGSQGWCDIGYNFLVDKYGQIFEGRKGGITKMVRGAHAGVNAANERTVGVSMMGNYDVAQVPTAMKTAVADLIAWRHSLAGLKATGTYSLGGKTVNRIMGHRDVKSTACPGRYGYAWLTQSGGLRSEVAKRLASGGTPTPTPPATPIQKLADSIGAAKLGALVRAEYGTETNRRAVWKNMDILWTSRYGAHSISGLTKKEFYRLGGHTGKLGYPRTTQSSGTVPVQRFYEGSVYLVTSGGTTKAYGIYGALWDAYVEIVQSKKNPLGVPTSPVTTPRAGVEAISFTNGTLEHDLATGKVTRTSTAGGSTGPTPASPIQKLASSIGAAKLGALVKAEYGTETNRRAVWKNMDILWTSTYGAHSISGLTKKEFYRLGGHTGKLGFPRTTQSSGTVPVQRFQEGAVYLVTSGGTTKAYGIYGGLWDEYVEIVQSKKNPLGVPTSPVTSPRAGVEAMSFKNGTLELNTSTGVVTRRSTAAGATGSNAAWNQATIPSSGKVTVTGHGYGHGIGMSQYGAEGAARDGKSFRTILTTYYPGVRIESGNATIRVLLSSTSSSTVEVRPRSGMVFRRPGVSGSTTLPTSISGAKPSKWRITPIIADKRTSVLQYYAGGWKTYKNTKWTGDGEFAVVGGQVDLLLPGGKVASYRNAVRSAVATKGATTRKVVNVLSLDAYTLGVVAAEMPSSWQMEALKAQSVAARTYARRALTPSRYYDVCDTTACQVYRGVSSETARTNSAALATRGLVMTYKGAPVLAQYSSSNGGHSAPGSQPYLSAKSDPWDGWSGNKNHDWSVSITSAALKKAYPTIGTPRSISVLKRDGGGEWGGRVTSVKIVGSTRSVTVTGPELRFALGLKSAFFRLG